MRPREIVLCIALAFALGCAAAPVVNRFVVAPAQAAPEGVRKLEQRCSWIPTNNDIDTSGVDQDVRNRGLEGFELATGPSFLGGRSGTGFVVCYRRPIL